MGVMAVEHGAEGWECGSDGDDEAEEDAQEDDDERGDSRVPFAGKHTSLGLELSRETAEAVQCAAGLGAEDSEDRQREATRIASHRVAMEQSGTIARLYDLYSNMVTTLVEVRGMQLIHAGRLVERPMSHDEFFEWAHAWSGTVRARDGTWELPTSVRVVLEDSSDEEDGSDSDSSAPDRRRRKRKNAGGSLPRRAEAYVREALRDTPHAADHLVRIDKAWVTGARMPVGLAMERAASAVGETPVYSEAPSMRAAQVDAMVCAEDAAAEFAAMEHGLRRRVVRVDAHALVMEAFPADGEDVCGVFLPTAPPRATKAWDTFTHMVRASCATNGWTKAIIGCTSRPPDRVASWATWMRGTLKIECEFITLKALAGAKAQRATHVLNTRAATGELFSDAMGEILRAFPDFDVSQTAILKQSDPMATRMGVAGKDHLVLSVTQHEGGEGLHVYHVESTKAQ